MPEDYICNVCNKPCPDQEALNRHKGQAHKRTVKKLNTGKKKKKKVHRRKHAGTKRAEASEVTMESLDDVHCPNCRMPMKPVIQLARRHKISMLQTPHEKP